MIDNLAGAVWRLAVFMAVCALGLVAILAIFAQLRFEQSRTYNAEFTNVTGLRAGDFVRIAGVEVGKVRRISLTPAAVPVVEFTADESVVLTAGTRAAVRYDNLIGDRYLALEEGAGGIEPMNAGGTIPLARTAPALDLDVLIGGFRPLFRALDPDQVNMLSGQLIQAFQGRGAMIGSFLANTAVLTNTLADRDQLIGEVIDNLAIVLESLGEHSTQLGQGVDSLTNLLEALAARRSEIGTGVASTNDAAANIADLLTRSQEPVRAVIRETDRTAGIVVADHDYMDDLLDTLPDTYQALARQGIYGDFFSFYLCDLVLKLNGKGGQPVYIKVAGQSTGRCAPK